MKKINAIALFFTTVLALLTISCIHLGNEKIVRTERTLNPFESVNCGENAEIRFHTSQEYHAVLTVDSNLEQFVVLKIKNKKLTIKTKPGPSCLFSTFIVDIYCPYLSGVALSGSGHFSGIDKIIAPSFKSHISGSGKIEGSVECGDYIANISGSGSIIYRGTPKVNFSGSGSGRIKSE